MNKVLHGDKFHPDGSDENQPPTQRLETRNASSILIEALRLDRGPLHLERSVEVTYTPHFGLCGRLILDAFRRLLSYPDKFYIEKQFTPWDILLMSSLIFYRRICDIMQIRGHRDPVIGEVHDQLSKLVSHNTVIPGFMVDAYTSFSSCPHPYYGGHIHPALHKSDFNPINGLSDAALLRLPHIPELLRHLRDSLSGTQPSNDSTSEHLSCMKKFMPCFYPTLPGRSKLPRQWRERKAKWENGSFGNITNGQQNLIDFFNFPVLKEHIIEIDFAWTVFCSKFHSNVSYSDLPLTGSSAGLAVSYILDRHLSVASCAIEQRSMARLDRHSLAQCMTFCPNASFSNLEGVSQEAQKPAIKGSSCFLEALPFVTHHSSLAPRLGQYADCFIN